MSGGANGRPGVPSRASSGDKRADLGLTGVEHSSTEVPSSVAVDTDADRHRYRYRVSTSKKGRVWARSARWIGRGVGGFPVGLSSTTPTRLFLPSSRLSPLSLVLRSGNSCAPLVSHHQQAPSRPIKECDGAPDSSICSSLGWRRSLPPLLRQSVLSPCLSMPPHARQLARTSPEPSACLVWCGVLLCLCSQDMSPFPSWASSSILTTALQTPRCWPRCYSQA